MGIALSEWVALIWRDFFGTALFSFANIIVFILHLLTEFEKKITLHLIVIEYWFTGKYLNYFPTSLWWMCDLKFDEPESLFWPSCAGCYNVRIRIFSKNIKHQLIVEIFYNLNIHTPYFKCEYYKEYSIIKKLHEIMDSVNFFR